MRLWGGFCFLLGVDPDLTHFGLAGIWVKFWSGYHQIGSAVWFFVHSDGFSTIFSLCLLWPVLPLLLPNVMTFGKVDMVSFITRKPPGNSMVSRVALLFSLFSSNSRTQNPVHLLGCIPLGYRGDMGVGVQGESCTEMAQHP